MIDRQQSQLSAFPILANQSECVMLDTKDLLEHAERCEQADFNRTEHDGVWKPMGRASYIGPAGSGQIAKLANQIMVACNIASVAQGRSNGRSPNLAARASHAFAL